MKSGKWFETTIALLLIFLGAIMCTIVVSGSDKEQGHWSVHLNATPYMYVGDHDRLYVFDDNVVYAVNPDGSLAWQYSAPAGWSIISRWERISTVRAEADGGVSSSYNVRSYPVFADDSGTLYLYTYQSPYEIVFHRDNATGQYSQEFRPTNLTGEKLLAIADGHILWERSLPGGSSQYEYGTEIARTDGLSLEVAGGKLYLFRLNNVTVLGQNGTFLYEVGRFSDPPAIDGQGRIYGVEAQKPGWLLDKPWFSPQLALPSNTVKAYSADGSLLWSKAVEGTIVRPDLIDVITPRTETAMIAPVGPTEHLSLPLFDHGRVIVPLLDGVTVLDSDGTALWTEHLGCNATLIDGTPFDSEGNLYLTETYESYYSHYNGSPKLVYIIAPDGSYTTSELWHENGSDYMIGAADGKGYFNNGIGNKDSLPDLGALLPMNVTARDLRTGKDLWTFRVPASHTVTVTVTADNVGSLLTGDWAIEKSIYYNKDHPYLRYEKNLQYAVYGEEIVNVLPAHDVVYVSYYGFNYEHPILPEGQGYIAGTANPGMIITPHYLGASWGFPYVATFNKSKLVYASGICALDRNGTLLWQKPTDSFVMGMAANNSTLYYGTKSGGVSGLGLAAGLTTAAAALLVLRFLAIGAVSRARCRLEQNENRLAILKYIQESPGSTMYEISRALEMNMGTMRYHLLILGINHKVREYKDGKYVRYFSGSRAFTPEELEVTSLLRREPVRKLMSLLCQQPGISNAEIARALGISESAVSNYLKELSTRGFVAREVTPAGRVAYTIKKEHVDRIERSLEIG